MNRLLKLAALFGLAFCLTGQNASTVVRFTTDIAGTGATVRVTATATAATMIQFVAASGNSGTARCGGSGVTSSSGFRLPAGAGQFLPPIPQGTSGLKFYDVSQYYCYVANSDVVTVTAWN